MQLSDTNYELAVEIISMATRNTIIIVSFQGSFVSREFPVICILCIGLSAFVLCIYAVDSLCLPCVTLFDK